MNDKDKAALRALAEKATLGMASAMTGKQIGEATAAIVALRDEMHPAAVLSLLDEVERLREALETLNLIGGLGHKEHHIVNVALDLETPAA